MAAIQIDDGGGKAARPEHVHLKLARTLRNREIKTITWVAKAHPIN
jgi:hypothetical protein